MFNDEMTKDETIAKALARILENQIKLGKHLGLISDDSEYGDCYYDRELIEKLEKIE